MAAILHTQKQVLALQEEAALGTFESDIGASDVLENVYGVNLSIVNETVERQKMGALGNQKRAEGAKSTGLTFQTHWHGKGSSGVPAWSGWLKACGMSLSTATYSTTDTVSDWKTLSGLHYQDGRGKKARGLMGSFTLNMEAGRPWTCDWEFQGGFVEDPAAVAIATGTYEAVRIPSWEGSGSFTIDGSGTDAVVRTASLTLGNQLTRREDPSSVGGYLSGWIGNRLPVLTLSHEAYAFATKNWYAAKNAGTEYDIVLVLNGGSNNTITLTCNDCEPSDDPADEDQDGKLYDALGFEIHGAVTIAFT